MTEKPGTPAPRTARLPFDELCRDTPCPLLHAAGRKACHVVFDAGGDSEGAFCSSRIALALERALAEAEAKAADATRDADIAEAQVSRLTADRAAIIEQCARAAQECLDNGSPEHIVGEIRALSSTPTDKGSGPAQEALQTVSGSTTSGGSKT